MGSRLRTVAARFLVLAGALLCGAPALVPGPAVRAQGVHAHGIARVGIAVEGTRAMIEIMAPADGIYGFEHEPRTAAERQRRRFGLALLANSLPRLVRLDPALGCRFAAPRFESGGPAAASAAAPADGHDHGHEDHDTEAALTAQHAEVAVRVEVRCARPLAGSEARFGFTGIFPAIPTVELQLLTDSAQSGMRIVNDQGSVRL